MNNENIHLISSLFADGGREYLRIIQSLLSDLCIQVQSVAPSKIEFSPWEIRDISEAGAVLKGEVVWNPVTNDIVIEYKIWPKRPMMLSTFSRLLRWYLLKWNEEHRESLQGITFRFIYPGSSNDEITLQARSKVHLKSIRKRLRLVLLKSDTILKEEWDIINSLLHGECPALIRTEVMNEIKSVLLELKIGLNEVYEDRQNEEGISF